MKLSDQVCTLEQAKKLNELGVLNDEESYFVWYQTLPERWLLNVRWSRSATDNFPNTKKYNAFSVAELGIMLPEYIETHRSDHGKTRWYCGKLELQDGDSWFSNDTQAQCMAAYLLQLLEQDLIKVEEVNKRLKQ